MPTNSFMNFITRQDVAGSLEEIKTSYQWQLQIDTYPAAVYFPGTSLFQTRLASVTPPRTSLTNPIISEKLHNFTINQYGSTDTSGEVTLTFRDFIDQSIENIFQDWFNKIQDPQTQVGLPKNVLYMDCTIYQLDRRLNPIKSWVCKTGLLASFNSGENMTGEINNQPTISATIHFEYVVPYILNQ
jgi:hypothetical protein